MASGVASFASGVASLAFGVASFASGVASFAFGVASFAVGVASFAFGVAAFAFGGVAFAFRGGTFAFVGGRPVSFSGSSARDQLLDAIVPKGAIGAGGPFHVCGQRFAQRFERCLTMVVVGGCGDAAACPDVGTFASPLEAFDQDLALRLRQFVQLLLQDETKDASM